MLKHVLDRECSEKIIKMIRMECKLEFMPPGWDRYNIFGAAINTFKNHFVAILSGTDLTFTVSLWDKPPHQVELTIKVLRHSNNVPTVLTKAHLFETFDFNRMLLAPLNWAVQIHKYADKRETWAVHTVDEWYLGTSPDHYHSQPIYVKKIRTESVSEMFLLSTSTWRICQYHN